MALETELRGDTQLVLRRLLPAPPERVFAAHTEADLVRRWMVGSPGSEITHCEHDARPGGSFRMRWRGDFPAFEITGEYIALDPPHRIEHVERMHLPEFTTEDTHIVTTFTPEGQGTRMEMVMTFESAEAREAALSTGMLDGMEAC
ncbi:SRPBCC domain-containing protein [Roseibacterium sp. SDUM158016]|uniref:SRPBCC family protein n=1 Tax=Roseicyclus sediminis TaxID=2980997 RepID=UPI0021CEEC52|nr:SRPBCC domain-containing protein [Roseibacterium sp. SDUM158016]MCU4655199.1 SRPBCC domain-containing protein [Roseibacterium sp. SDUM158016]